MRERISIKYKCKYHEWENDRQENKQTDRQYCFWYKVGNIQVSPQYYRWNTQGDWKKIGSIYSKPMGVYG